MTAFAADTFSVVDANTAFAIGGDQRTPGNNTALTIGQGSNAVILGPTSRWQHCPCRYQDQLGLAADPFPGIRNACGALMRA
jgi:hypothetical protein